MFLYELAMEFGDRSTDLAERAERLGLGTMSPTDALTPQQVAQLRAEKYGHTMPTGPAQPTPVDTAPTGGGRNLGQIAAVGAVLVMVVGFFVWMAANTGPDEERQRRLDAEAKAAKNETPVTFAPGIPTTEPDDEPSPGPSSPSGSKGSSDAADEDLFCTGAQAMGVYETTMSSFMKAGDYAEAIRSAGEGRAAMEAGMDQMAQGGPPGMAAAIAQYRKVYGPVLDGIAQADGVAGLQAAVANADRAAIDAATNDIFPVITELCT